MIKVSAWHHEICNHLSVIDIGHEVEGDGDREWREELTQSHGRLRRNDDVISAMD